MIAWEHRQKDREFKRKLGADLRIIVQYLLDHDEDDLAIAAQRAKDLICGVQPTLKEVDEVATSIYHLHPTWVKTFHTSEDPEAVKAAAFMVGLYRKHGVIEIENEGRIIV